MVQWSLWKPLAVLRAGPQREQHKGTKPSHPEQMSILQLINSYSNDGAGTGFITFNTAACEQNSNRINTD